MNTVKFKAAILVLLLQSLCLVVFGSDLLASLGHIDAFGSVQVQRSINQIGPFHFFFFKYETDVLLFDLYGKEPRIQK